MERGFSVKNDGMDTLFFINSQKREKGIINIKSGIYNIIDTFGCPKYTPTRKIGIHINYYFADAVQSYSALELPNAFTQQ